MMWNKSIKVSGSLRSSIAIIKWGVDIAHGFGSSLEYYHSWIKKLNDGS